MQYRTGLCHARYQRKIRLDFNGLSIPQALAASRADRGRIRVKQEHPNSFLAGGCRDAGRPADARCRRLCYGAGSRAGAVCPLRPGTRMLGGYGTIFGSPWQPGPKARRS